MSKFFINRPIFAWVVAIVIMVAGILAILGLPISQYPTIAPPAVSIKATYPGASAGVLQDSVTQVIEQKMNGLDHLRYMESTSDATGSVEITLTFEPGTDPDIAQVQVQNKLQLATPLLPQEVQKQGVAVSKSTRNYLLVLAFVSEDGSMSAGDLGDFVASKIQDPISRVPGVGDVLMFGSQYAMRVWLDPDKLQSFGLTVSDVSAAITAQNAQVSAGQIGGLPATGNQLLNATINAQSRLETPAQFEAILVRVLPDGSQIRLRDIARVELGSDNYTTQARFNGKPAAAMAIRPATGSNALDTVDGVRRLLAEMQPFFPAGLKVEYPLDTTPFVRVSIHEVVKTLVEAVVLVFLVMYLFLQNFRATLIPTIAVPVVLLGTFGVMSAFGFSINTLTLFGVVLAIGLLVDDAIVVVENVERVMAEEGLSPKAATLKSMGQITGALVGIGMVLSAVFIPMAFFSGSAGVIYRQFSVTIVSAMALSVLVAIVFTPALTATLLKPVRAGHHAEKRGFFGWFNRVFNRGADRYARSVGGAVRRGGRMLLIFALIVGAAAAIYPRIPGGFLPDEDQGFMFALGQLPAGTTTETSAEVLKRMETHFLENEKDSVEAVLGVLGYSFAGSGQNQTFMFIKMRPWEERPRAEQRIKAVQMRAYGAFMQISKAIALPIMPPAVMEMGMANGFDFRLKDNGGVGHERLMEARNQLLGMAMQDPRLINVRPNGLEDQMQYQIDVDQEKAAALGVSLTEINRTISTAWGSSYVDDFLDRGRVKRVFMQADSAFRREEGDLNRWYVRNAQGRMTPFSAFSTGRWTVGSPRLERFNGTPSRAIQGEPAPGRSTGEAMAAMEEFAAKLPPGIGFEWAGLSYEERAAGSQSTTLYAISLLIVFLCLAALYESWAIPAAVLLVVPLGLLGTLLAVMARGFANDVYFQVGLLTVVGLSAKNAILIVEFAKEGFERGLSLTEAAVDAARQRLRPILMTSLAFGLGVLPLAISTGAGSGSQNAIGTGIIGGTLTSTILGVFFIPVFFVVVLKLFRVRRASEKAAAEEAAAATLAPAQDAHH